MRRWKPDRMYNVSGIDLRIAEGIKSPEDLRLEVLTSDGWRPVDMALPFFMVDFFTENERYLNPYRGHWRANGDSYFMRKCIEAWKKGWRVPTDEIERQRRGKAS